MLYFLSKFSHQTADSQGYSAPTGVYPCQPIHYPFTETIAEGEIPISRPEIGPQRIVMPGIHSRVLGGRYSATLIRWKKKPWPIAVSPVNWFCGGLVGT